MLGDYGVREVEKKVIKDKVDNCIEYWLVNLVV